MSGTPYARGIVVLGPHRSGTSAVTGALAALGLHPCPEADRMPVRRWNARGNFESQTITRFDERLLHRLGGAWWAPPAMRPGWADDPALADMRTEAATLFSAAHPLTPWVWKDPRACTLMPFWESVLGSGIPRVIVVRHPAETARSLFERNGMPLDHGLALAERCLRRSLLDSAGRPALVTAYDLLLEHTEAWCREAVHFIGRHCGALPEPPDFGRVLSFLDPALRHHREAEATSSPELPAVAANLWSWALNQVGEHDSLGVDGVPDESPQAAALMETALQGLERPEAKSFGPLDVTT